MLPDTASGLSGVPERGSGVLFNALKSQTRLTQVAEEKPGVPVILNCNDKKKNAAISAGLHVASLAGRLFSLYFYLPGRRVKSA